MKIVLPTDTSHEITLIPRYYPTGSTSLEIYNETTKETTKVVNAFTLSFEGFMYLSFDYNFEDKYKYQMKIHESEEVVFRGKILCTTQETQDYKLTKDLYYYE